MSQRRRRLQFAFWLIFLLLVVAYLVYQAGHHAELRNFDWTRFLAAFAEARKSYLVAALLAIYVTYALRTWRWQSFSRPARPLRFAPVFSSTVMGFSAIMLLGRPGEIVRPVLIARKERVPLSAMMAIWAVERIFDTMMLLVLLGVVLVVSPAGLVVSGGGTAAVRTVREAGLAATVVAAIGIALLMLYRANPQRLRGLGRALHGILPARWHGRLDHSLHSFEDGLKFLREPRSLLLAVSLSVVLWLVICFSYWCICQSLGHAIAQLPATAVVVLVFSAMVGSAVQVPGVGGGLQAATFIALTTLFHVRAELAATAAILLWVISFCVVLMAGLPLLLYEGWSFTKLWRMAEAEVATENALAERNNVEARIRTVP